MSEEPVDGISPDLAPAVDAIVAAAQAEAADPRPVDPTAPDGRALVALHGLTHAALAHRTSEDRERLLAALRAGDTYPIALLSPRGRPALASVIGREVIVIAEVADLVPPDDLL